MRNDALTGMCCIALIMVVADVIVRRWPRNPEDALIAICGALAVIAGCLTGLGLWTADIWCQRVFSVVALIWVLERDNGGRRRKRVRKLLGEKSRAIRARLVAVLRGLGKRRVLVPRPVVGFDPGFRRG